MRTLRLTLILFAVWAESYGAGAFRIVHKSATEIVVQVSLPLCSSGEGCSTLVRLVAVPAGTLPEVAATGSVEVSLGSPVRFRDLQLVPVYFHSPTEGGEAQVDIRIPAGQLTPERVPASFAGIYQTLTLNELRLDPTAPEGYLIIVPDAFYENALALAQWKERKGFYVTVKKKSEVGVTAEQIRSYIANAYHTWPVPPTYVLLAGTIDQLPTFNIQGISGSTDHNYACLDGDDYFPEVFVGRLPVNTGPMLDYLTQKIFNYERTPFRDDTMWFRRAMMIATIYQEGGTPTVTALATKRWVRDLMLTKGFGEVDTVFDPPYHSSGVAPVDSSFRKGVCLVNGRGWGNSGGWNYPPFRTSDIAILNNGWRQPVITSLYCGTGAFSSGGTAFGESWLRAGSPSQPKGAVAFFGPTILATSTRWNNCLDYGIYHGIFRENLTTLGAAMLRGKLEVYLNFPMPSDSVMRRAYFYTYNILGDPSLQLWCGAVPQVMEVQVPEVAVGMSSLEIQTIPGARVCLIQGNNLKQVTQSDISGHASFCFPPLTDETLFVTVTKPGYAPVERVILPSLMDPYLAHYDHSPASCTPGSNINLLLGLRNSGATQTARNVNVLIRTGDPFVTITDSTCSVGDIAPGSVIQAGPFNLTVSPACTNNHQIRFYLIITSPDGSWLSGFRLPVEAARFSYCRHTGAPAPGEVDNIIVTLHNCGSRAVTALTAILRSTSPAMIVEDSAAVLGTVFPGDSVSSVNDVFRVRTHPDLAKGRSVGFELLLRGDGNFEQTIRFAITAGVPDASSPLGPDGYGYYAYDDIDIRYPSHPSFAWYEIDPNYGGAGTRLIISNDATRIINLPFTFRYYGQDYRRITVCDNGFLTCDSTNLTSIYNWRIPSAYGPSSLIAPFWDDFRADTGQASGIYYYYDTGNHRFIVQWSRIHHIHGFRSPVLAELQTFQVMLYDPAYHPTRTGDGKILFQYHTVFNDDSATGNCHNRASVGIANRTQDIGLQCAFADSLAPASAEITSGRAILFTTDPPDTFAGIAQPPHEAGVGSELNLSVVPNPVWGRARISYVLPTAGVVSLRIYDAAGRRMWSRDRWQAAGSYVSALTGFARAAGVYLLDLTLKGQEGRIFRKRQTIVVGPNSTFVE